MSRAGAADPIPPGVLREAVIDLDAIAGNLARLRERIGTAHTMAVVKADGYGHGAVPAARAALAGGADWLGVADVDEALELRAAGITAPVLAWLHAPGADFTAAVREGVDIGVSSPQQLDAAAAAADRLHAGPAAVQLKFETGLSRNGIAPRDCADVCARAARLESDGLVRVRGLFSHVSNTSRAEDLAQVAAFEEGVATARSAGLDPELLHLAATAAALTVPESRYSMVRLGIGVYGISPFEPCRAHPAVDGLGLTPAMTLRAPVAAVRRVAAGSGVSYGFTYRTAHETTLALVPLGYADGVPRQASNGGAVLIGGRTHRVAGRVAMDQFVVDLGAAGDAPAPVRVGDAAVLFGDPRTGAPSVDDWARAAGTIAYDIVTRIGPRVHRSYRGGAR